VGRNAPHKQEENEWKGVDIMNEYRAIVLCHYEHLDSTASMNDAFYPMMQTFLPV
jgi:hypothetical protein